MAITVRAEFTSRPARRDDFVKLAAALTKAAADEPGTLRYDWFLGAGPDDFVVIEEYLDSEAAFAHNAHCADLFEHRPRSGRDDSRPAARRTFPGARDLDRLESDRSGVPAAGLKPLSRPSVGMSDKRHYVNY